MRRSREAKREAVEREVRAKLDKLGPPWLPMRYDGPANMLEREWVEYRERRARHLALNREYESGWNRPETGEKVWRLLASTFPQPLPRLTPAYGYLTDDELHELDKVARKALVVVLDCFMIEGRMPTFNAVFDALGAGWSDTFRDVTSNSRAFTAYDMREDTVRCIRRDLIRNGVHFEALWRVVTGQWSEGENCRNPLFFLTLIPGRSYRARLKPSLKGQQFEEAIQDDQCYRRPDRGWKLLLAEEKTPERAVRQEITAEHPYNVVHLGKESKRLLEIQEGARILFDVDTFKDDYDAAKRKLETVHMHLMMQRIDPGLSSQPPRKLKKAERLDGKEVPTERQINVWTVFPQTQPEYRKNRREAWGMLHEYDRLEAFRTGLGGVYDQVKNRTGLLPIKSGFTRVINRRFQPTHFWPTYVSTRAPERWDEEPTPEELSMRRRWFKTRPDITPFKNHREVPGQVTTIVQADGSIIDVEAPPDLASQLSQIPAGTHVKITYGGSNDWRVEAELPLVGLDVSASQTQILAIFLGLDQLEARASAREPRFTDYLTRLAWAQRENLLRASVEEVENYRGPDDERLRDAVKNLWMRVWYGSPVPWIIFQHSWKKGVYGPGWVSVKAVAKFLDAVPQFKEASTFLDACRAIAKRQYQKNPFLGIVLHDPSDGEEVRWNPVVREEKNVGSGGRHIIIRPPRGKPNEAGDYSVSEGDLAKMVLPCLVHMLDAYYSSLVMSALNKAKYRDLIGIHDCWLLPDTAGALDVIRLAQIFAGDAWLRGLERVYDDLILHLAGTKYENWMQTVRSRWKERVRAKRWPYLTARPGT